jgi:hypothetical protein
MSNFVARHKFRMSAAAAVVAAVVASASLAGAQVIQPAPDGGPHVDPQPALTTTCGPNVGSTLVTQSTPMTMNMVPFQPLPGASVTVDVPDGKEQCIKVLFTAETACGLTANPDFCYVRARIDATPMDPNGSPHQAIDSEDATASAHAFEWVADHVQPGPHTVTIDWRVRNAGTPFDIDDWTMDVQAYDK